MSQSAGEEGKSEDEWLTPAVQGEVGCGELDVCDRESSLLIWLAQRWNRMEEKSCAMARNGNGGVMGGMHRHSHFSGS